jgi:AmmeMemoRadiSam system protein B/AmmeMemoRadiSam system protein A
MPVAAYSYAALKGRKYARVVVLSPSHYESFGFSSVYDGDAYETPLGIIPVDKEFAGRLTAMDPSIRFSDSGHRHLPEGAEHGLEVQLPWLQHLLGDFALVPVTMGDQSYLTCRALGCALASLITAEGDTLIVASSDLSHFHPHNQAVKMDHKTLNALEVWDYFTMARNFESRAWEACGGGPVVAAMIAAERLGARQVRVLKYAHSGNVTGDFERVVGYAAALLVKSEGTVGSAPPFTLSGVDQSELLALARQSVEHAVRTGEAFEPAPSDRSALQQERGAFVTLRIDGALRGCIGFTSTVKPLFATVRDAATLAALRDPRFPPVAIEELAKLQYEISVLSPLRRVLNAEEVQIGRHGLFVRQGRHEGLLLPQVPLEQGWDRVKFLQQTCAKAQLAADAWQDEETDIFTFTAVIFGDEQA